jgi:hypothetical protein
MERTLHRQLKLLYADDSSQTEVRVGDYRIDAIAGDDLIEIQCASLSAIRPKCRELVKTHRLRVVKPLVMRTRIRKLTRRGGTQTMRRMSPKQGSIQDLFAELVYFTDLIPHPNLTIEVPLIHVQQTRVPRTSRRRRWWGSDFEVIDVELESIEKTLEIYDAADLWSMMSIDPLQGDFNTSDLAKATGASRHAAQQMAYVLRETGAVQTISRKRTGMVYRAVA